MYAAPIPGIIPVMGGAATRHRQQTSDPVYNRSGSPVSIQEQRILQVSNAGPDEASSSSAAINYPSTADATTAYDGKGRPINLGGEKPALVHLDGGRYEEPSAGGGGDGVAPRPMGAAPPAYSG